jgi:GNAT superfamily N-acetyltransferase
MSASTGPDGGIRGRLVRTARDLWLMFREQGPKAPLADIRDMVRSRLYFTNDQLVVKKELGGSEPAAVRTALRVETADMSHLPVLAAFNRRHCNTRRTHGFQTSLAAGERAMLAFVGDELIGYFWWLDAERAADGFYLNRFGITLTDEEVYGYEFVVAPEHRAGGTAAAFLATAESELARLGYRRIYGCVESWNLPARWLYSIQGYEVVRRSRTRTVLGRLILVEGSAFLSVGKGLRPLRTSLAGRH